MPEEDSSKTILVKYFAQCPPHPNHTECYPSNQCSFSSLPIQELEGNFLKNEDTREFKKSGY